MLQSLSALEKGLRADLDTMRYARDRAVGDGRPRRVFSMITDMTDILGTGFAA